MRVLTCDNTKREYRGLPIDTHRIPTWLRDRNSESERKWDFCSAFKIKKKKKSTNSTYLASTCLQLAKISLKSHLLHGTFNVAEKYIYAVKIQML